MPFDLDSQRELSPVPLTVAPTREQRARWLSRAQEQGLDLHAWMIDALEREAGEQKARRLVGADRGRE